MSEPALGHRELSFLEICLLCLCNPRPNITRSKAGKDCSPWLEQQEPGDDLLFSIADGAEGG